MRITLAAGLFAIGVELPQSYLADHALGLCVMVVPTMAFGWLVVAGKSICAFTEAVPLISIRSRDIRRVPAHQLHLVPRHCRPERRLVRYPRKEIGREGRGPC